MEDVIKRHAQGKAPQSQWRRFLIVCIANKRGTSKVNALTHAVLARLDFMGKALHYQAKDELNALYKFLKDCQHFLKRENCSP